MRNFSIQFHNPWLLLLLIPAFALTIFLYFRLNKRFRKTRNRIVSMVLHSIIMVLCICVLAGIHFDYQQTNLENELILLVDVSDTEEESAEARDEFVRLAVQESRYYGIKMGVVTFGFDQTYAVPLTYEVDTIYDSYLESLRTPELMPDRSATDISAALEFAQGLFEHPETAKIVLVSDGKETDESAASVVGAIARQGIIVDTAHISSSYEKDNVQVVGVDYPDYHINRGEEFTLSVGLRCREAVPDAVVEVYDNGVLAENMKQAVGLTPGSQYITFETAFEKEGLHEISVRVTCGDGLEQNNRYTSYYYLEVFSRVLIIEHTAGESVALKNLLSEEEIYLDNVDILNLTNYGEGELPETVDDLRQYDQVILNNIANADLKDLPVPATWKTDDGKDWFVKNLYSYVYDYGGGLLTVGGKDGEGENAKAHAYNREDLYNTLFQELLPVQAINYTPPVGVMIIIDISGSMGDPNDEKSPLYFAKQGAISCLDALTDRDYVGIMTLDDVYGTILPLTRRTEETRIREAILGIGMGGGTVFSDSIKTAGERLRQLSTVDKRHMVLVTDGMPTAGDSENYLSLAHDFYEKDGITISVVGVGISKGDSVYNNMLELTTAGGGQLHTASGRELIDEMREDLNAPEIKEVEYEEFYPLINNAFSPLLNGIIDEGETEAKQLDVPLNGFFGVKKRESADMVLMGEYEVPIYAQWKYGRGMVGSFMCDLDGSADSWSIDFMASEHGKRFIWNVVANLMPTENIRPNEIRVDLKEENYINQLNIYTTLSDGQRIEGKIIEITDQGEIEHSMNEAPETESKDFYITGYLSSENRYTRCSFVAKRSGIYKIVITKYEMNGGEETVRSSVEIYKSFSYSEEYDSHLEEEETDAAAVLLEQIAERGGGSVIAPDSPWDVFQDFVTALDRTYDPRLPLIIIAMVLFLLDIVVRKFKFKWIHEIVRESKEKKAANKS